ncbi:MAG: IS1634 family transposase, partial [Deltaproteobacteria bacterium]|nr:IS1634 family transposase [Deltaproteobacteria bacterium]
MSGLTSQNFTSKQIGHLGLVAGMIDELGISGIIDETMPKTRDHILPHSAVIKAMLLNGLGFNERRLYIFSRFFSNLSTEQLFGVGITPEHLNDDVLLRTLDRIYDYGSTDLFNKIVMEVMKKTPFGTHLLHADTTSFSVYGDYDDDEEDFKTIQITYGHSKDHREDLKQFVLSMVTNQHGIPLFTQPYSGNESDKKILLETILKIQQNLNTQDKSYYIADSAFYTEHNLQTLGRHTFWISHVPGTIAQAKSLLAAETPMVPGQDPGYSFHECLEDYGGINQKWVLVSSEKGRLRQEKTYERNLKKRIESARKSLKKLKAKEFACEPDARRAAERWFADHPFLRPDGILITTSQKKTNKKRGRPSKEDIVETVFSFESPLEVIPEIIEREKHGLGRFVLATNDVDLDVDTILKYYKGQQSVERGFRFLKDKSFRVAEVFLKKESRIEALSMLMVLCLFVYAAAEWYLRLKLKESGATVKNQLKKPVQNPTMKWIFTIFMRPAEVIFSMNSQSKRFIVNLEDETLDILKVMGPSFSNYYFVRGSCE